MNRYKLSPLPPRTVCRCISRTGRRPVAVIRPARADDLARLGEVERAAGSSFRDIGMGWVADDEPLTVSDLTGYQRPWDWLDGRVSPCADPSPVSATLSR